MKVKFFYDYICPFCYIASNRLIRLSKEFGFEIEWFGIEIHPEFTNEGNKRKKTVRFQHIIETLNEVAKDDNTEIKLPGFVTNSRLCLEASIFAKEKDKFLPFHNSVYSSYFNNKVNIGIVENILQIAEKSGLDSSELYEALKKRKYKNTITENQKFADENMVLGVPTIYFNDLRIHGTQSIDVYRILINKELSKKDNTH
ncbi:MAG: DsbA family oxidoreductase [Thermodesulfobacteriota bacterium]